MLNDIPWPLWQKCWISMRIWHQFGSEQTGCKLTSIREVDDYFKCREQTIPNGSPRIIETELSCGRQEMDGKVSRRKSFSIYPDGMSGWVCSCGVAGLNLAPFQISFPGRFDLPKRVEPHKWMSTASQKTCATVQKHREEDSHQLWFFCNCGSTETRIYGDNHCMRIPFPKQHPESRKVE
jgi:hypothetical protein